MTEIKRFHHGNLKDELIEVTIRFITEQKDTNISIREIANSLGVTHAAVYRHFESKAELLCAVATSGYLLLAKCLEEEMAKVKNLRPRPLLYGVLSAYIDFALANEGYYRTMFNREIMKLNDEELQKVSVVYLDILHQTIILVEKKNSLKNTLNVDTLVVNIWASLHGYVTLLIDGKIDENITLPCKPITNRQSFINLLIGSMIELAI